MLGQAASPATASHFYPLPCWPGVSQGVTHQPAPWLMRGAGPGEARAANPKPRALGGQETGRPSRSALTMRGAQCHWGAIGRSRAVTVVCECATVPHTRRLRRPGGRRRGSLQRQVHRARCSFHLNPRSAGDWEGPGWLPLGGRITGDLKPFLCVNFPVNINSAICFQSRFFFFFPEEERLQVDNCGTHCEGCGTAPSARPL